MVHPLWSKLVGYLVVTPCAGDGMEEPRIRIEFLGIPERLAREAAFAQMPCVCCGRPINFLRLRVGDEWSDATRLYYAPCCPVNVRVACSRGAHARAEYDRFTAGDRRKVTQLEMF